MKKRVGIVVSALVIVALVYFGLYGRLMPFCPLIVGFEKNETDRATLYFHGRAPMDGLGAIDEWIAQVEAFHGLHYADKVAVFICATDREYKRLTGITAQFNSQPIYGRIFISKGARDKYEQDKPGLRIYLMHELSHSLIQQNLSFTQTLGYPLWLLEGIAMASAGQIGTGIYPSKAATGTIIRAGHFFEPEDYGTVLHARQTAMDALPVENKIAFVYSEFGCIIDDLIHRYGQDCFQNFLKQSIWDRAGYQESFERVYSISFSAYLEVFKTDMRKVA